MDSVSQERLDSLLNLDEGAMSEDDKAFIAARRDYLSQAQLAQFSFLADAPKAKSKKSAENSEE